MDKTMATHEPGEYIPDDEPVTINEGRETATVEVENTGDRPVQVGSHFHFFEVNRALRFNRGAAYGMRLDIPAGTAVRFEPGDVETVEVVEYGGERDLHGFNSLTEDADGKEEALEKAREEGFEGA